LIKPKDNTIFGTSIFEPVAETLASLRFPAAQKQFVVGDTISEQAQLEIQHIMNELTTGKNPNKSVFFKIQESQRWPSRDDWSFIVRRGTALSCETLPASGK